MNRLPSLILAAGAACLFGACSPQGSGGQPAGAATTAEGVETGEPLEGGHGASLVPMLTCDATSMLSATTTRASLVEAHGAYNVREQQVAWADSQANAVVLFPDDPSMRAEILWLDDAAGAPDAARVSGGPDSLWVGPGGLLLGSALVDIEEANGGPVMVTAFGNHNHGEVSNFLGGKLAQAASSGCRMSLALDAAPGAPESAIAAVTGDSERSFRSDDPILRAAQPIIVEMSILFFKP